VGDTKRLLIINPKQFGYHLDTYYYCKWAPAEFRTTYHGFDAGEPKLALEGVAVDYVPRQGHLLARYLRFLRSCITECHKGYDVIFVKYFPGCSVLRVLNPRDRLVLDIRTGSIALHPGKRRWLNRILRLESLFFRHVTIISASLADRLGLDRRNVHVLPLGADPVKTVRKEFSSLHFLYVGTLSGRRIEDTILGFHKFYQEAGRTADMTYEIIGEGYHGELGRLRALVEKLGLDRVVSLPGYIHHRELASRYEKCNAGVSYVPIDDIYDCQPPTKTFEYLLAGMPVIATNTSENASVITEHNGVLIDDTPEGFYEGAKSLARNRRTYDSNAIRTNALQYSWETIVHSNLVPYLCSVADG
jgi:glycosyltransferase involved in cell wall biosynthesis